MQQHVRPLHPGSHGLLRATPRRRVLAHVGIRPSGRHDAAIWDLAGPAVLALAADPLLGVVDTAFVGRLGPEALVRAYPYAVQLPYCGCGRHLHCAPVVAPRRLVCRINRQIFRACELSVSCVGYTCGLLRA